MPELFHGLHLRLERVLVQKVVCGWTATVGEAPGRQKRKNGSYCRSQALVLGQTQPGLQPSTLPGVSMRGPCAHPLLSPDTGPLIPEVWGPNPLVLPKEIDDTGTLSDLVVLVAFPSH